MWCIAEFLHESDCTLTECRAQAIDLGVSGGQRNDERIFDKRL